MNNIDLKIIATEVRKCILDEVYLAKSGHPGGSLSIADLLTFLYFEEMNINPEQPLLYERDKFILSKGHSAPALYAVLAIKGYFRKDELLNLRKYNSFLQGHPCMINTPGVDMSTGSLGQGLSVACGMALGNKMNNLENRVYCLCGDGEIEEGQIWEAAMFAGYRKLNNLCLIIDNNNLQIDGKLEAVCSPYPIDKKFEAFNFNTINIDGHNFDEIRNAFKLAKKCNDKPTCIIMKTIKGKGVSFMENNPTWHGKAPNEEEYTIAINELNKISSDLEDKNVL